MSESNGFFETLKERLTSPFWGPFIYSWLILNWRVPVFLLTGEYTAEARVFQVERYLRENPTHWLYPIGIAIGYVSIGKFVAHLYEAFPRWLALRKTIADNLASELQDHALRYNSTLAGYIFRSRGELREALDKVRFGDQQLKSGNLTKGLDQLKRAITSFEHIEKQMDLISKSNLENNPADISNVYGSFAILSFLGLEAPTEKRIGYFSRGKLFRKTIVNSKFRNFKNESEVETKE